MVIMYSNAFQKKKTENQETGGALKPSEQEM